jgi:NADPH:quinone reductase-like Zn-dependent oxidoreductase
VELPQTGLQLRSLIRPEGVLELSLAEVPVQAPGPGEVLVRVEATPINPSDLGLLLAGADVGDANVAGSPDRPVVTIPLSSAIMAASAARVGQSMPVGNEGAGVVIAAGSSPDAQALLGKTVAILGGAMYAQYRTMKADQCLLLPEGTTPAEGASCFVNPLTVLGMVETMRREGHRAIVHTAAASNLGQMLNRLCIADGIPLVNIVRRDEHVALLQDQGAKYVLNSTAADFMARLTDACAETGATLGFDAIGGGRIAGQILAAMEAAALRTATGFNRYGSNVHKQVYIYGSLDRGPTEFVRNFGLSWSIGGWLLTPFLQRIGPEATEQLRRRVAAEIRTTFASHYTKTVSLAGVLDLENMKVYSRQATGEKYLVAPNQA